jgi:hypothetical protein
MIHITPDLSHGILREKKGKRFFLRLWPDPVLLQEERPGIWSDVEDVRDDFNLTILVEERDRLYRKLIDDYPDMAASIIRGQRFQEGFDLPLELQPLMRLQRRIEQREIFLSAVPAEILEVIRRYPESHFALLKLFGRHPDALDLAETNPALAFLIATREKGRDTSHMPSLPGPAGLLRSKRTLIASHLSFSPPTKSLVRILGKVSPWACRAALLPGLRHVLCKREGVERLRHLPAINLGCLAIASDVALLARVSNSVLLEIASSPEEISKQVTAEKLKSCLALEEAGQIPRLPRMFHSLKKIHVTVLENAEYMHPEAIETLGLSIPPPPLPDTQQIRALRSIEDVYEEASEQENCVWSLLPHLVSGKLFLYRVLAPERATLSLDYQDGLYRLEELERACNEPVSPDTEAYVQQWIKEANGAAIGNTL